MFGSLGCLGMLGGALIVGFLERSAVVDDASCPLFGFRSVTQGGANASGLRQISVQAEESPYVETRDLRFDLSEENFL